MKLYYKPGAYAQIVSSQQSHLAKIITVIWRSSGQKAKSLTEDVERPLLVFINSKYEIARATASGLFFPVGVLISITAMYI